MPTTKSAIKAARQNIKRRVFNQANIAKFKKAIKQVKKLVTANQLAEAKKALSAAYAALDKAAKKNTIKKNTASRLKSRLTKLVAKAKA